MSWLSSKEELSFNISTRMKVIRECYPDTQRVHIYALADLTNENDITTDWGKYVLDNIDNTRLVYPE